MKKLGKGRGKAANHTEAASLRPIGLGIAGEGVCAAAVMDAICAWFATQARPLPWREETGGNEAGSNEDVPLSAKPDLASASFTESSLNHPDALLFYRVLVSEFMLQQTRVATVLTYFEPFLERFPSLAALAEASEDQVLTQWAGLGYYRRARALHSVAQTLQARGTLPWEVAELERLPGIGPYTARALVMFGRKQTGSGSQVPQVPIDGNVYRVLVRLHAIDRPEPEARRLAETWVREVLEPTLKLTQGSSRQPTGSGGASRVGTDPRQPLPMMPPTARAFAEGLIELGALVCKPKVPDCGACPLEAHCLGRGRSDLPRVKVRALIPQRKALALLIYRKTPPDSGATSRDPQFAFLLGRRGADPESERSEQVPEPGSKQIAGSGLLMGMLLPPLLLEHKLDARPSEPRELGDSGSSGESAVVRSTGEPLIPVASGEMEKILAVEVPALSLGEVVRKRFPELATLKVGPWVSCGRVRHVFTHFRLEAHVLSAVVDPASWEGRLGWEWVSLEVPRALPKLSRKLLRCGIDAVQEGSNPLSKQTRHKPLHE